MLEQGEILTLDDDKEYTVTFTTMLDNKNYVFLLETNNYENNMFCEYVDGGLEEVVDINIIEKLLENFKDYVKQ
jgi:hypothetical protein